MLPVTIPFHAPLRNVVLSFNGQNQLAQIPQLGDLKLDGTESFTVEFWISAPVAQRDLSEDYNFVMRKFTFSSTEQRLPLSITIHNGRASATNGRLVAVFGISNSTISHVLTVHSPGPINDGVFHHVAVVFAAGDATTTLRMYIDGSKQGEVTILERLPDFGNDAPLLVGGGYLQPGQRNLFTGELARIRLWKGALSDGEVKISMRRDYASVYSWMQAPGIGVSLAGNWPCDEGYGALVRDTVANNTGLLGEAGVPTTLPPGWRVSSILPPFLPILSFDPDSPIARSANTTHAEAE